MTKGMVIRGKKQINAIRQHEVRFLRFEKAVKTKIAAVTGGSALAAIAGWQMLLDKVESGTQAFGADKVAGLQEMHGQLAEALDGLRMAVTSGGDIVQQVEMLGFQIATIHQQLEALLPEGYEPLVKGAFKNVPDDTVKALVAFVTG